MTFILLADAGSTKTHWAIVTLYGGLRTATEFSSGGINPSLMDAEAVSGVVAAAFAPHAEALRRVERAYYYGAGCRNEATCRRVSVAIAPYLAKGAQIEVDSDAVGAARALIGNGSGVAAILGTGANAMLVENGQITDRIPPMGYILGDEGSGAWLGRRLINAVFKRQLPPEIISAFRQQYPLELSEIIEAVYHPGGQGAGQGTPSLPPSTFLASFAPFLKEHIHHRSIAALVEEGFGLFIGRNVAPMLADRPHIHTIGFVGSIACEFEPQLRAALHATSLTPSNSSPTPLTLGRLLRAPLPALIATIK